MLEMGTSGLMSGAGKRGGASASALAPGLDSTSRGSLQLGALGLVVNIIILWNTLYINAALEQLAGEGYAIRSRR